MLNSNLFPYEYESISKLLQTIDKKDINLFAQCNEKKEAEVPKYLICFDKNTKKFYQISAKRFMENNYVSTYVISASFDYYLTKTKRNAVYRNTKEYYDNRFTDASDMLDVFFMQDYYEIYPDNGYDLFVESEGENKAKEITYALVYQEYPIIKDLLKKGLNNLVSYYIGDEEFWYECQNLNNHKLLKAMNDAPLNQIDNYMTELIHLYNKKKINEKDFLFIINNSDYQIYQHLHLFVKDKHDCKALIDYLNRCEIYQAIDAKAALGYLELYTESKESVGLKNIEKYPVSLRKEYKRLSVISGAFERACLDYSVKEKCRRNRLLKDEYEYHEKGYCIKVETDYDHLKEELKYIKSTQIEFIGCNKYGNYYWLYDKNGNEMFFFETTYSNTLSSLYQTELKKYGVEINNVVNNFINRLQIKNNKKII